MKVEKVPDSTYDMIGGLDQQIKEIKEVWPSLKPLHIPPESNLVLHLDQLTRLASIWGCLGE